MHRTASLLLLLLPAPARAADICAQERPDWSPDQGPATALNELFFLATSLPGLGLLGALTLAVLTGQKRYFAVSALFATLIAAALAVQSAAPDALTRTAIAEGCVGPQGLAIATCAIVAVVSLASLAWLWLRGRRRARI